MVLLLAISKGLLRHFGALPIPFLGPMLDTAITLYFMMVEMRLLGILYNANLEKLNWLDGC